MGSFLSYLEVQARDWARFDIVWLCGLPVGVILAETPWCDPLIAPIAMQTFCSPSGGTSIVSQLSDDPS